MSVEEKNGPPLQSLHQPHLTRTATIVDVGISSSSKKRKCDGFESSAYGQLVGKDLIIEAHPSSPLANAYRLTIRSLLPRSCIPLAYLNLCDGGQRLLGSTMFILHVEDLENGDQSTSISSLLIAQSGEDGSLYAIERVHDDVYAFCKLARWVDLRYLDRIRPPHVVSSLCQHGAYGTADVKSSEAWWDATTTHARSISRQEPAQICALRLSLAKGSQAESEQERNPAQTDRADIYRLDTAIPWASVHEEKDVDHKQDFEAITKQYQESLYASKASLAYFAKGPLSRARANINSRGNFKKDSSRLIDFLRSSILPLSTLDRKYRETLPGIVKDLPFSLLSEDETAAALAKTVKKAQRSKKHNIGKNGLLSGEELNIARWWLSRDVIDVTCDTDGAREDIVRMTLLEQKFRETQLQVILVLETLALEASVSIMSPQEHSSIEVDDLRSKDLERNPNKHRKPLELNTLLDLLADRLFIWQSMESEGNKIINETESASQRTEGQDSDKLKLDHLRQFGVDVILPFYGARLPEKSTSLCQKLGGPNQFSPKRPFKAGVPGSARPAAKPDTNSLRHQLHRPKRTLERVMTDEKSNSRRKSLSLSRSATEPNQPQLKREISDISLSSIPINKVCLSKRYSQREVDLHFASQATEAKQKKRATIEQELQGAITALKKPNPRLAVKELVEAAEKRTSGSRSRKTKNPVRNPFAPGVQVIATPSKNRQKDNFGSLPCLHRKGGTTLAEVEEIPPSSISRIPSSTAKDRRHLAPDPREKEGPNSFGLPTIEQTPTKGPLKFYGRPSPFSAIRQQAGRSLQSCLKAPELLAGSTRSSLKSEWVSSERDIGSALSERCATEREVAPEEPGLQMTPPGLNDTPNPAGESFQDSSQEDINIYTRLNWDNDYDETL